MTIEDVHYCRHATPSFMICTECDHSDPLFKCARCKYEYTPKDMDDPGCPVCHGQLVFRFKEIDPYYTDKSERTAETLEQFGRMMLIVIFLVAFWALFFSF